MKRRVLIVPAAGFGTRLHSPLPKLLVPVRGIPMLDRLHQLYSGRVGRTIIVTNPAARPLVEDHVERRSDVEVVVQEKPTGMLDAISIGAAAIASFPAREVVMGVLGVIYQLGPDVDVGGEEDQNRLQDRLRAAKWDDTWKPVYNLAVALSIMVFFALCAQCAATLMVIKRETNSWRWPVFTFAYMTILAYLGALVTYQVGTRL